MVGKSDINVPQEVALRGYAIKILNSLYKRELRFNQTVGLQYTYIEPIKSHIDKLEAAILSSPDKEDQFNEEIKSCKEMLVDPSEQVSVVNFPDEKPVPIEQFSKVETMENPGDLIITFE